MSDATTAKHAWIAFFVGAAVFVPGARIPVGAEDPIFYFYELLVAVVAVFAINEYWLTGRVKPVRWSSHLTIAVSVLFVVASVLGDGPLLSMGIARVTVEGAIVAWAVPALLGRFGWRTFVWGAMGGLLFHALLFAIALGQGTEGTYNVTLTVRNEVRMLGGSLNSAAAVFVLLLPFAVVALASSEKWLRRLGYIGAPLAVWALVISESRALAGGLALVVGAFIVGCLTDTRTVGRPIRLAGFLFLAGAVLASFTPDIVSGSNALYDEIQTVIASGSSGSAGDTPGLDEPDEEIDQRNESSDLRRGAAWQLAIDDFVLHPILGTGFRQRHLEGARDFFAHNVILENLAGTGALGTLAWAALAALYAILWFRRRWGFFRVLLASGVVAGFAVGLVQPFLNTSHHFAAMWWLTLALGASSELELLPNSEKTSDVSEQIKAESAG